MRVSLFRHWRDNAPTQIDLPFADFAAELGTDEIGPVSDKRQTPAFSPVEFAAGKPRKDEFAIAVHAAVFDFDGSEKKGETEEGVQRLLNALQGDSFVVYSSFSHRDVAEGSRYKFRLVLELSRPVLAAEWRGFWRRLAAQLPIAHDPSCVNEARIYGLPVMHSAHDFVQRFEGAPIDVDSVLALPDPQPTRQAATAAARERNQTAVVLEARLDRKEVSKLATKWSKSAHADTAKRGRLVKAILNGDPYATSETGRHETARELTIFLEAAFPSTSPEAIASIFRTSVVSMAADDPSWDIDQRLEDIERLVEGAREMRLDAEAEAAELRAAEEQKAIAQARPDGKLEKYGPDDFTALAAIAGCPVEHVDHAWIVVKGPGYYFLTLDGYKGPYTSSEFPAAARLWLSPAANRLQLTYFTREGEERLRAIGEIVRDYGTAAEKVIVDLGAQTAKLSSDRVITEAPCKLRPLSSEWDPEFEKIDRYVTLFAGPQVERYKDWLATFPELSRCTSALSLSGPKDTGKNLTFNALGRLFTTGAPTDLNEAIGDFNSAILNCPLLVADEKLPTGLKSADLRKLIGSMSRPLNRKFAPSAEMIGAIRMILIANRDDLLAFEEVMTVDELDATAVRILHIETQPAAAEYLRQTPHRHWVTEDLFARYVLWLQKTRAVDRSGRWLVEGHMPEVRAKLATGGRAQGRMCEWLVGYLMAPERITNTAEAPLVTVRDGSLFVNARAPCLQWSAYVSDSGRNDTPTQTQSTMALKGLARASKEIKVAKSALNFWQIDLDNVLRWAEANGLGDVQQMRARVQPAAV